MWASSSAAWRTACHSPAMSFVLTAQVPYRSSGCIENSSVAHKRRTASLFVLIARG